MLGVLAVSVLTSKIAAGQEISYSTNGYFSAVLDGLDQTTIDELMANAVGGYVLVSHGHSNTLMWRAASTPPLQHDPSLTFDRHGNVVGLGITTPADGMARGYDRPRAQLLVTPEPDAAVLIATGFVPLIAVGWRRRSVRANRLDG